MDMVRSPSQAICVYVGLPNHVHHEAVALAAAAGKAVLSEKSLTVSMRQADELLASVDGKAFFVEGLMYLAHPLMTRFVEVLCDGRLGRLAAVHGAYSADIARLVNPAGRGAIFNLGCYPVSLLQLVVDAALGDGAFADHTLDGQGRISPDGNVGEAAAAVRFGDAAGPLATIYTAETFGMDFRFEVYGSNGSLAFETNPWLPQPGDTVFTWRPHGAEPERIVVSDPLDAFDHQIRMVERQVAQGRLEAQRPSPRLRDSRAIMTMLTAWDAAARAAADDLS